MLKSLDRGKDNSTHLVSNTNSVINGNSTYPNQVHNVYNGTHGNPTPGHHSTLYNTLLKTGTANPYYHPKPVEQLNGNTAKAVIPDYGAYNVYSNNSRKRKNYSVDISNTL